MADPRKIRTLQPLSPEWYAEAYRRMNLIMGKVWALPFPHNVVMWTIVVPWLAGMFSIGVFKHAFIKWFFR